MVLVNNKYNVLYSVPYLTLPYFTPMRSRGAINQLPNSRAYAGIMGKLKFTYGFRTYAGGSTW